MFETNHSKTNHIDKQNQSVHHKFILKYSHDDNKRNFVQSYHHTLINKSIFGNDSLIGLTPNRAVGMPVVAKESNPSWSMLTNEVRNKTNTTEGVYVPGRGK